MKKKQNISMEIEYGKGNLKEILIEVIREEYIARLRKTGDEWFESNKLL